MIKLTVLLFVVIWGTMVGISIVAVLAMSSPISGGSLLSQQGMMLVWVTLGATVAALPISYIIAGKLNKAMNT